MVIDTDHDYLAYNDESLIMIKANENQFLGQFSDVKLLNNFQTLYSWSELMLECDSGKEVTM